MANGADFRHICFVIMPFGEKPVANEKGEQRTVDFDAIYDRIFEPALRAVALPEGGTLDPRRTDRDFFSGSISQEMFEYLEYSRMALADITGLNPNVFYELGVRHRARQAGTVIFRQLLAKIPFDINQIKAFPYEYEPDDHARESAALITRVVTESLGQNRMDSPVQLALQVQRHEHAFIEADLREAENALRVGDRARAVAAYTKAVAEDPGNNLLHLRRGLLLKDLGQWEAALDAFNQAVAMAPGYAEAHREKGIAENKLFHRAGRPGGMPDGLVALQRAAELNPGDYDAYASLGGALKRAGRLPEALAAYERAVEVSHGHSYPLLNAITLAARLGGTLAIDGKRKFLLGRAEKSLRAQVASEPPYDPPWSFFDLAQVRLYAGDRAEFLSLVQRGIENATHAWQADTFRESLASLLEAGVDLPGLREAIDVLTDARNYLE